MSQTEGRRHGGGGLSPSGCQQELGCGNPCRSGGPVRAEGNSLNWVINSGEITAEPCLGTGIRGEEDGVPLWALSIPIS